MKIVFVTIMILSTIASLGQSKEKSKVEPDIYKLNAQIINDGQKDTIISGFELIKIYTPTYFEFVTLKQNGDFEFGIASYTQSNNQLTQHWFSTVWAIDSSMNFTVEITNSDTGYIQKLPELPWAKKFSLTEEYSTISATGTSYLDGAWKVNKSIVIKGFDTVINKVVK